MRDTLLSTGLLIICFYNPDDRRYGGEPQPPPEARTKYQTAWEVLGALCTALHVLLSFTNLFVASDILYEYAPFVAEHKVSIFILGGLACALSILMCIPTRRAQLQDKIVRGTRYVIKTVSY